jgi:hypothetical protein
MPDQKKPKPDKKRSYQEPTLRKVDLRPEEAVLGSCKSASVSGPGNPGCLDGGDCFTTGS